MGKVSFTSLKLKINTEVKEVQFLNNTIEVLQYLPVEEKYNLIVITAQNALEHGFYNPVLLDKLFHLYLVYMYSNITFTDKQKESADKIYDALKSNGLLDLIINAIPQEEYDSLFTQLEEYVYVSEKYNRSAAGLVSGLINDLPVQAQMAKDILDNFKQSDYQSVIDFAKAANGGKDI